MGALHNALDKQINLLPQKALAEILSKKLKAAGVRAHRQKSEELAALIIKSPAESFEWDGIKKDIEINFDESDYRELEKISKRYADAIGDVVSKLCTAFSIKLAGEFEQSWREHRYQYVRYDRGFKDRLEDRWGEGLDHLRMLVEFSVDVGNGFNERLSRSRAKRHINLRHALSRLHIRACQVSNEILVLIENGYPDGAMARWRTLHEIVTTAFLINDGGDDLAQRYLRYDVVETKKALDEFAKHRAILGQKGPSKRSIKAAEIELDAAIEDYGKAFGKSYGWAAEFLGNPSPRFVDIQNAAGTAMMQFDYKIASLNVHATPRALNARIGSLHWPNKLISGATNAGLADPGQSLAITLPKITSLLSEPKTSIDNAINLKTSLILREKAINALLKAEKDLLADDNAIREALGNQGEFTEIVW